MSSDSAHPLPAAAPAASNGHNEGAHRDSASRPASAPAVAVPPAQASPAVPAPAAAATAAESASDAPREPGGRRGRVMAGGIASALLILLVAAVTWKVFDNLSAEPPQRPGGAAVAVDTAPVEVRAIRSVGHYSGSVWPASEVQVAPQIAGQIRRIHVDLGDEIQRGAVLVELDDREANQRVLQAQADFRVAEAAREARIAERNARKRDLDRLRALFSEDARIVTRADLDAAESTLEQAEANVAVAEATVTERHAALAAARIRQSMTRVEATWLREGQVQYVAARHREVGETISANVPVLIVVDLDRVRVVVTVPERQYVQLQVGQQATIRSAAYRDRRFVGTVRRIAPSFDDALREARVEIEVANEDHALKPGMFVQVDLVFQTVENATAVPATALVTRGGQLGVLHVVPASGEQSQPTARFVPVTVGARDEGYVHVIEPPLQGRVVTLGGHLVEDGAALRLADEPAAAATPGRREG